MAKVQIHIRDLPNGQVETRIETQPSDDPNAPEKRTAAQRLALLIRRALIGDTWCVGLHMISDVKWIEECEGEDDDREDGEHEPVSHSG